jgi:8-oxo-dGTP pyrophosphatase MutT (NUDIX family)
VISPYIKAMRERIGNELLLVPTVAVLVRDDADRLLLVRSVDTGRWQTIGGTVEPDEDPADAAVREAREEAGVDVELRGILAVTGGPEFRLTYPNGDVCSCVTIIYDAVIVGGAPAPDQDEVSDVGWFGMAELPDLDVNEINRHLLLAGLEPGVARDD